MTTCYACETGLRVSHHLSCTHKYTKKPPRPLILHCIHLERSICTFSPRQLFLSFSMSFLLICCVDTSNHSALIYKILFSLFNTVCLCRLSGQLYFADLLILSTISAHFCPLFTKHNRWRSSDVKASSMRARSSTMRSCAFALWCE